MEIGNETNAIKELILYTIPNCTNCSLLKNKLKESDIKYKEECLDTQEKIEKIVNETQIMSAPIIKYNGKWYDYNSFMDILK